MRGYPKYKDTGINWIADIPEQWGLKKIKHTTYVKGRIGWKGLKSDEFKEVSDAYLVTGTDFKDGKVRWELCYQINNKRYDEDPYIQLKENDLLLTKDGSIGKIALVKGLNGLATLNSGIFLTRPLSHYITDFLYWILCSDVFYSFISYNSMGSTIQHLYQNVFNEFQFPTPLLPEQSQIANYLDHKTAQIDSLIEKKKKLIELLKEERTAVINQAVTKGLDPNFPMKDSGIEWLGEIPAHWEVKRVKYLLDDIIDNRGRTPPFGTEGVPMLEVKQLDEEMEYPSLNFEKFVKQEHVNKYVRKHLQKGDILIATVGATAGKTAVILENPDYFIAQNIIAFRVNKYCHYKFLFYIVKSTYFQTSLNMINKSNTIDNLKVSIFINNICMLPNLMEQIQITDHIEKETNRIDAIISKSEKEIDLLHEYRTALISEVVTGKIDVREETI